MTKKFYIICYILNLGLLTIVAYFQRSPGYMDADYYYATGKEIAKGNGLSEPFIWNYLDNPDGVPHPSHAYWSPLASFIAATGMIITRRNSFDGGRIFFILLSAFTPILTGLLTAKFTKRPSSISLAMCLGIFSGFYLAYLGTTDTFGIYMLLGCLWLLVALNIYEGTGSPIKSALLGIIAGFMHLARADGIIWILLALLFVQCVRPVGTHSNWKTISFRLAGVLVGYGIVMGPWMVRNLSVFGTPLSPAGSKVMWLASYNEIYVYPASKLTFESWLANGWGRIFSTVLTASWQNIQTTMVVQGQIFLFPLILLGGWQNRSHLLVRWGSLAWGLSFLVMSVIFPHAGWRGGFFHSGASLQILFFALAPSGLESFVQWGARARNWNAKLAFGVFGFGIILFATVITTFSTTRRVIGDDFFNPSWNFSDQTYQEIEAAIQELGINDNELVMVNNPPGYFVASGRGALAIPDGDISTMLVVAKRYGVEYIIVESNHPSGISSLFNQPGDLPSLTYQGTANNSYIYQVIRSINQ